MKNKIWIGVILVGVFLVTNFVSKDITLGMRDEQIAQLIGLGAVVFGYFAGKILKKNESIARE